MPKVNTKRMAKKLVAHFGTQTATAKALGVTRMAVSHWVTGNVDISPISAIKAELATDGAFKASELSAQLAKL